MSPGPHFTVNAVPSRRVVHRPDFAVNAGHPVHVIGNARDRHASESFHQFPSGPIYGHENSEADICPCNYLLIF
jgi:hypothetical protein